MANEREERGEKEASRLAKERQQSERKAKPDWDKVLEADEESFPASDAPAWTSGGEGRPHYEPPKSESEEKPRGEPPRE